jgi:single-strand DNA-binding protein
VGIDSGGFVMARQSHAAQAPDPAESDRAVLSEHRNEVVIVGRISKPALAKLLPSGDEITTWRLVVDRPAGSTPRFDVVDCVAFGARVRRQSLAWTPDEIIEIGGALRRRYWRGPGGVQSRCEVAVSTAARVGRPVARRRARVPAPG